MAKYRKKPVIVEAEQFLGFYHSPYPPGVQMDDNSNNSDESEKHGRAVRAAGGRVAVRVMMAGVGSAT